MRTWLIAQTFVMTYLKTKQQKQDDIKRAIQKSGGWKVKYAAYNWDPNEA